MTCGEIEYAVGAVSSSSTTFKPNTCTHIWMLPCPLSMVSQAPPPNRDYAVM